MLGAAWGENPQQTRPLGRVNHFMLQSLSQQHQMWDSSSVKKGRGPRGLRFVPLAGVCLIPAVGMLCGIASLLGSMAFVQSRRGARQLGTRSRVR